MGTFCFILNSIGILLYLAWELAVQKPLSEHSITLKQCCMKPPSPIFLPFFALTMRVYPDLKQGKWRLMPGQAG